MFWNNKSAPFNPSQDIPSLKGKIILVTGGNSGLGKQSVLELARHTPACIWLAARSVEKAEIAVNDIRQQVPKASIKILKLDLGSFRSVRKAAETVISQSHRLDILMLNAGIMATDPGLTVDGYEIQFGTNHMGHALLATLLLPLLDQTSKRVEAADVRVVSLSSHGHTFAKDGFHFDTPKTRAEELGAFGRYYQSKLANVLWARHLAKLYPLITVSSVDPGLVGTQLMDGATGSPRYLRWIVKLGHGLLTSVEDGARNQLWACVSKGVESGEYYAPVGVGGSASVFGKDDALAKRVWEWTERELTASASEILQ